MSTRPVGPTPERMGLGRGLRMGIIAAATTAAGNVLVLAAALNFMHVVSCAGILFIIKPNA